MRKEDEKNSPNDQTLMVNLNSIDAQEKDHPAVLTQIAGEGMGKTWPLSSSLTLGRSQDSGIYIPNQSISRKHVEFIIEKDQVKVQDLKSTNGIFVNNEKIPPGKTWSLKHNDLIKCGNLVFKFSEKGRIEAPFAFQTTKAIYTDSLCQIPNRKFFFETAKEWIQKKQPSSLILFDIDDFKKINDQYGHMGGDFVLYSLSSFVRKKIRQADIFCRTGGEEFAILSAGPLKDALCLAEKIRDLSSKETFEFDNYYIRITLSLGVSEFQKDDSPESLFKRADEACYQAKNNGRNQVSSK